MTIEQERLTPTQEDREALHAMAPVDPQELEDFISDSIADSLDMDWSSRDGARAIVRAFASEGFRVVRI